MSDSLLIHYSPARSNPPAEATATWALCNQQGELTGKLDSGPLSSIKASNIAAIANAGHIVVLLDSRHLHLNQVQLPTQNKHKMLRAVPYALEEFIADDVDDMHFVIATGKQQNTTAVAGIRKQTLQAILDDFSEAGLVIDSLVPDALCLAVDDKQWAVLCFNDNSYLQTASYTGSVFNNNILPLILQKSLQQAGDEAPEKLLVFTHSDDAGSDAYIQNIQQTINDNESSQSKSEDNPQNKSLELVTIRYNTHPLVVFCGHYKQALALNLLQGEFKNQRKSSGNLRYWRLAAALAVIWLTLHLGLIAYQKNNLEQKNTEALQQIKNIYKKTFPGSKRIVNPRVQMEQKLKALKKGGGNDSGFLYLLSESFGKQGMDKKDITLQTLNYRNNRMDIGLESTNLQAIENLNKQLNTNPKIKAEITSSSSEKNKVKGNLRIESRATGKRQ